MGIQDGDPLRARRPTAALYRKARSGDRKALGELYDRYLPRLLKWAEARVDDEAKKLVDTDALVREALLETLQRPPSSSGRESGFIGEARRVIDDTFASEISARHRRRAPRAPGPDRYEQAFRALDLNDQSVIGARLEEGLSYEEIAAEAGLPDADAARKRVGEAILRLAERMRSGS